MENTKSTISLATPIINEPIEQSVEQEALVQALGAFSKWRAAKTTPAERIPSELWQQIFALEKYYSATQLRSFFSLSSQQYKSKKNIFSYNANQNLQQQNLDGTTSTASVINSPQLCQVNIKKEPKTKEKGKLNLYKKEPLPSAKTLVVEFCRSDGQVMKIHTTQDSISTLMQTFLGGEA